MPNIEVSKKDFESLCGKSFTRAQLEETLEFVKGEIDAMDGDVLRIDCKEPNRPDLWSAEGLAREIKARTGKDTGISKYTVHKGDVNVHIDSNLRSIRPLIACAVVKGVKVDDNFIKQIVQLQEKVGESFGRKRKELGVGLYDFDIMAPPIHYGGFADDKIEFVPLEWKVAMRPSEILAQHDKGKAYRHLLQDAKVFPIVIDSKNVVASMPPIINSQITGKVTEKTKNLFIECTGFKWETVRTGLEVICMALADRGGKIYSCHLHFPSENKPYPAKAIFTPEFSTQKMSFDKSLIEKKSGLKLKDKEIIDLLSCARFETEIKWDKVKVEYSSYRTDIMHPVDVIEDLLISYGFNNIVPKKIEMNVVGSQLKESEYVDFVRSGCVGECLQEVMTYNLTSRAIQAEKMQLPSDEFIEIANPVSQNYEILRKRLAPQLLDFLSKNKDKEFPQRIFEVGTTLELRAGTQHGIHESNHLCVAVTHSNVNYTEIKSFFDSLCKYLGLSPQIKKHAFPFLGENAAQIIIGDKKGFIGEVKKEVIEAFGLRKPVALFEIEL